MTDDAAAVDGYDPFAPDTLACPFDAYDRLLAECPVAHVAGFGEGGFYVLSQHDDVVDLFTDLDRWSGRWGQGPIYVEEGGLRSDPPEHDTYRRLVTGFFTARRVRELEPLIEATASALVDRFRGAGQVDLVEAFASPLPMTVIATILGVPVERHDDFRQWSNDFMAAQNADDPAVQGRARAVIDDFFAGQLAARRAEAEARPDVDPRDLLPDDALTSLLLAERDGRPFTDAELLPLLLLLLVGGNETTTSLIGSLVVRLLEAGRWDEVAADDDLLGVAIEESLRIDPPVLGLFRTARGEQWVHDVTVPDEAKVQGLYAAANRDPAVWEHPDEFRLDRTPAELRQHLSFGVGITVCPGAALARAEARIAIRALAEALPGLHLAGEPARTPSFLTWGPSALPVAWDAS